MFDLHFPIFTLQPNKSFLLVQNGCLHHDLNCQRYYNNTPILLLDKRVTAYLMIYGQRSHRLTLPICKKKFVHGAVLRPLSIKFDIKALHWKSCYFVDNCVQGKWEFQELTYSLQHFLALFPWRWGWRQLCYPQFWISLLCIVELRWKGAFVSDIMSKFRSGLNIERARFSLTLPSTSALSLTYKEKEE